MAWLIDTNVLLRSLQPHHRMERYGLAVMTPRQVLAESGKPPDV